MEDTSPLPLLHPASRDDVAETLRYVLRYDLSGRPYRQGSEMAVAMAADLLVAHLERSGFVLMRRPAARAHSAG
jgi:hypothetical protein